MAGKYIFPLLFLMFFYFDASGQNDYKKLIIGTWEEVPDTSNFAIRRSMGFKTVDTFKTILNFKSNGVLDFEQMGSKYKAKYSVKDSTLTMGDRIYTIKGLNSKELFLEDDFFRVSIYKKTDKILADVKEIETIQEFYSNGQMKLQGRLKNGFRDGAWIEWFEDGKVKKVSYFSKEAPFMVVVFDKDGKVASKTWYDLDTAQRVSE